MWYDACPVLSRQGSRPTAEDMRSGPCSRLIASLMISTLIGASLVPTVPAQAPSDSVLQQQTRPRRATKQPSPEQSWPVSTSDAIEIETTRLKSEPLMRIALATGAHSVSISTESRLMRSGDIGANATPLAVSRLRVEAHRLSPIPMKPGATTDSSFRLEITGVSARAEAERVARRIEAINGGKIETRYDAETKTWRVAIGEKLARKDADELREQLEEAGLASDLVVDSGPAEAALLMTAKTDPKAANRPALLSYSNDVRPTAKASLPSREIVAYAAGSTRLLSSSAPVTFYSDDTLKAPIRFNEKPYRGQLEVFANPGGSLTVVNVVGLEDYVRGVVPNELSPGGYGALEALKAQAVAARTYAVKNRGAFASRGFDLLPTTRSQVYGGLSTEHPLATKAVDETRGIIATYHGEPINALYTSTCGGRTEDARNIFGEDLPYLRGRECAPEGSAAFTPFMIKSSREIPDIREEPNVGLARDVAVLSVHSFGLNVHITDAWLGSPVSTGEIRSWLATAAALAHAPTPQIGEDATRLPGFSSSLAAAIFGAGRADTLLNNADVNYLLAFGDAEEIPARNRADVAMLLRDGFVSLFPDGGLHPGEAMTRGRALHAIARILEGRGLVQLQKATTRPANAGAFVLRTTKGRDQSIRVSQVAYLFRTFGDGVPHQSQSLALVGGEPTIFHINSAGEVDYLEVRPAPNGASSDRFSNFTNWSRELSLAQARARLAHWSRNAGPLVDLRIAAQGSSRRTTDLEIVGSRGTVHLRGGKIRSALGLHEQLFVIDRLYDSEGHLYAFVFHGRGLGHGVGMCQVGAYGLARAGWPYDRILKAYYTGVELTKAY
jgi:stage II sporulation protein D